MIRNDQRQTQNSPTLERGAPMIREQQPTSRSAFARGHTSGRAWTARALAIGLLACASVLSVGANNSHPARAAASAAAATFQVTDISSWVNTGAGHIDTSCTPTMPFTFLGIVTFPAGNPGGTLTYFWGRDNALGGDQPIQNVTIQPGQTELQVTDSVNASAALGNGQIHWDELFVNAPTTTSSNATEISFVCGFYVTSATGSVSPTTWCPPPLLFASRTFTFTYTINVNPSSGGTVSYTITRTVPGGTSTTVTSQAQVSAGASSITVSDAWTLLARAATGQYTEALTTTSPNGVSSNTVVFTKTC
jgi:hypothetical protein